MRKIIKYNGEAVRRSYKGLYLYLMLEIYDSENNIFLEPIPIDIWLMKFE
jgi:hypothetical protein